MTNDYHHHLDDNNENKLRINHETSSIQPFDDGHIPETFRHCMTHDDHENQQPRIVIHHHPNNNPSSSSSPSPQIAVYSNALPPSLTDAIYNTSHDTPSWGDYVTIDEAKNYHPSSSSCSSSRHDLSIAAVSTLFLSKALSSSITSALLPDIHGVAVWVLSSSESNEVRYHVDYAELVRYEHNVIYPPLIAGTVQCSKVEMEGGDFALTTEGWSHYERHGYKGVKSGDDLGGYDETTAALFDNVSVAAGRNVRYLDEEVAVEGGWVTIPYRYNQACIHVGHYPHLSTKIRKLPAGYKRVIMGFNAFDRCVGPLVQKAPEHSAVFNRKVKLYQALAKTSLKAAATTEVTETLTKMSSVGDTRRISYSPGAAAAAGSSDDCDSSRPPRKNGIDVNFVKRHKALTKLLVLAKREKVKEHLKQETKLLTQRLLNMFDNDSTDYSNSTNTTPVTTSTTTHGDCCSSKSYSVQYLMTTLSGNEGTTPRPVDVQVCVNQLIRKGVLMICSSKGDADDGVNRCCFDDVGFVLPTAVVTKKTI